MLKRSFFIITLMCIYAATSLAQNANSSPTRPRTSATPAAKKAPAQNVEEAGTAQTEPTPTPRAPARRTGSRTEPSAKDVVAVVNSLVAGIEASNVGAVTGVYWNSPQLVLFNNNGSVTKGWEQMRRNRESSYKDVKDVKLEVRDVSITMLGRDGAVVSCLWTQSQTNKGAPDSASGRMTLVFKRIGKDWKVIHLHTSDPARALSVDKPTPSTSPQE